MKTQVIAILDPDEQYAGRLAEYMRNRKTFPFEAAAFTDPDRLLSYARGRRIHCLAAEDSLWQQAARAVRPAVCFVLTDTPDQSAQALMEGAKQPDGQEMKIVFLDRYQPADEMVTAMLDVYAGGAGKTVPDTGPGARAGGKTLPDAGQAVPAGRKAPADREEREEYGILPVSVVYSPVGRCGKTCFAIAFGEALAVKERVLYLNLEDYSGFEMINAASGRMRQTGDLSDLLYFARQGDGNLVYKLNSMVQTWNNLDYIEPPFSSADFREVKADEWIRLLGTLLGLGEYDRIVLDLGTQVEEVWKILKCCEHIYVPVLDDMFSQAKLRQFWSNLDAAGGPDLAGRVMRLHLPAWQDGMTAGDFPRQLLRGRTAQYARRLALRESEEADEGR